MAHFGNCDPETADQEYCIFHKSNKTEEEAVEFYKRFLERFKPRVEEIEVEGQNIKRLVFEKPVNARGFVFPSWISFENAIFKEPVSFEKSTFEGSVSFSGAIFEDDVEFINCKFDGYSGSSFFDSKFNKRVDFSGSQFRGDVDFRYAEFKGESVFQRVTYEEDVDFGEAVFYGPVSFVNVIFMKEANFRGTSFSKQGDSSTNFWKSIFRGHAIFWNSKFYSKLDFWSVRFKGSASFAEATFHSKATFREVEFHGSVTFHSATFKDKFIVDSSTFNSSETFFWGAKFRRDVRFDFVTFKRGCSFKVRPDYVIEEEDHKDLKTEFEGNLKFSNVDIGMGIEIDLPTEWFKLPEAEIEARRVQRLSYEKEGRREDADRMFILEMRAKRKARLKNAHNKLEKIKANTHNFIEWLLADLPSEYGTNWVRLFLVSLLVILGNAVPYAIWSNLIEGFPETSNYFVRFANALYYSLVTFTTLGYGDMHPTGWLKALSGLEALTGAVFMALIVAVIARKWMR